MYAFKEAEHIHSLNDKPLIGTTTALGVIEKPLTWWASGMACAEFGWIPLNKDKDGNAIEFRDKEGMAKRLAEAKIACGRRFSEILAMTSSQFFDLVHSAYRAHNTKKKETAVAGTDLHAQVEAWIKWKMGIAQPPLFTDPRMEPFIEWCGANVKRFLWSEMCHYSEKLWVGGKSDFGYEDKDGNIVLGDIKSSKEAYFSHFAQAGAYDIQISENGGFNEEGKKMFELTKPISYYAIFCFGKPFTAPAIVRNTLSFKKAFTAALELYKAKQEFEGE